MWKSASVRPSCHSDSHSAADPCHLTCRRALTLKGQPRSVEDHEYCGDEHLDSSNDATDRGQRTAGRFGGCNDSPCPGRGKCLLGSAATCADDRSNRVVARESSSGTVRRFWSQLRTTPGLGAGSIRERPATRPESQPALCREGSIQRRRPRRPGSPSIELKAG
jgi:hypothetical protein